ncbi:hypothetical protein GCK72_022308 [Caenorhabditis remanei]|uniref:Potassium channel domain-containing protein n=1 Tax=Caenorhabditis remanei TaxID=31234 RepID=A0A6A5FU05_CAERE|nr:hypothetical protein GCK72_022308 [Caenorhabditis remanei]KAF1745861.1 hypothetical protein GCK72_022308 [Caenorhabditis remanei]
MCIFFNILAGIFMFCEKGPDIQARIEFQDRIEWAEKELLTDLMMLYLNDTLMKNETELEKRLSVKLNVYYEKSTISAYIKANTGETPWTWNGAMFYVAQIVSTIGYGNPNPITSCGRAITIIVAVIGIPFFLTYLKVFGEDMADTMTKLFKKLINKSCGKIQRKAVDDMIDLESGGLPMTKEKEKKAFPILAALAMLIVWILISAGLFCLWETNWSYSDSIYFTFVSLTTVGFGDMNFETPDMMLFNCGLIFVGLVLLTMCIDLITDAVTAWKKRTFAELKGKYEEMEKDLWEASCEDLCEESESCPRKIGFFIELKDWVAGKVIENQILPQKEDDEDLEENELSSHEMTSTNRIMRMAANFESGNDFKSLMFGQFLRNKQLPRYLKTKMVQRNTVSCQTDPVENNDSSSKSQADMKQCPMSCSMDDLRLSPLFEPTTEIYMQESNDSFLQYDHEDLRLMPGEMTIVRLRASSW